MGKVLAGKSVNGGIAIGRIHFMGKQHIAIDKEQATDAAVQIERFEQAREQAIDDLNRLQREAIGKVGKENAQIFQAQAMLLEDVEYQESVYHIIRTQETTAEYAIANTGEKFYQKLSGLADSYLRERAADVKDVSDRVLAILRGEDRAEEAAAKAMASEPVILAAEDLTPSQTIQLPKDRILSFVTKEGSVNSHTAILARTMNLPALVGIACTEEMDGRMAIVDGYQGKLYLEPDAETLQSYREQKAEEGKKQQKLAALKGKENITRDGRRIAVYANIGSVMDVPEVLANDAGGIGLFRSEFLYLERNGYPSEEMQFDAYREVAVAMAGKRVVIRTLDIGSDKQAAYFQLLEEQNPAMGYRGIRICLDRPQLFKIQLRAIYRASWYGNLSIMFPMIISVEEVRRAKEMIAQVKKELTAEGLPYRDCPVGIMIETPAAVMISDLLAKEVDFFSVGTNDLSQYTLAIDRLNPKLDSLYDPHHEAILRMLSMVVENGHKEGCPVSICGELAADVTLTETFLQMGVDALSVPPSMVLQVRERIRSISGRNPEE